MLLLYKSIQTSMILNRKEICYSCGNLDLSLCHFILSVMNSFYDTLVRSSSEGPEFFKSDRTLLQEHPKESCCSCGNLDLSYTILIQFFTQKLLDSRIWVRSKGEWRARAVTGFHTRATVAGLKVIWFISISTASTWLLGDNWLQCKIRESYLSHCSWGKGSLLTFFGNQG